METAERLDDAGLAWKVDEKFCYTTSRVVKSPPEELDCGNLKVPWRAAVDCLGFVVPGDGDNRRVVEHRQAGRDIPSWGLSASH